MNERIKELAEKASFLNKEEESIGYFAELIINDFLNEIEKENTLRHCAFTTHDLGTVECTIQKIVELVSKKYGITRVYRGRDEKSLL